MRHHEPIRDLNSLVELKRRLEEPPAVKIEVAAELLGLSERTLRRHLHEFEYRHTRRHIWVTLRSIALFLANINYQPSRDFDARKCGQ